MKLFFARFFRSIQVLHKRVQEDRVLETASSLTYQTALALVPLLAVLLAIAKGFSFDAFLENVLLKEFSQHQEILKYLLQFSKTTLEQMKSGLIAGLGVLFLLVTSTNLLSTTEDAMNRMWGVLSGRSLARRIADFQCCLFLFPLLLVIGSSTTLVIQTTISEWSEEGGISLVVEPLMLKALHLLPLVALWALFTLSYWLIPYVPVRKRYAVVTAAIVTLIFHVIQIWYIELQVSLTEISVIYGSFAALPLFLVWLWLSWLLFLIGSEFMVFLHEKGWRAIVFDWNESESVFFVGAMKLFQEVVDSFKRGEVYAVSSRKKLHGIPIRSLARMVQFLVEKQLVHSFSEGRTQIFLVPTQKALDSTLDDLLLPSLESLTPEDRLRIEQWKSQLHKKS